MLLYSIYLASRGKVSRRLGASWSLGARHQVQPVRLLRFRVQRSFTMFVLFHPPRRRKTEIDSPTALAGAVIHHSPNHRCTYR